MTNKCIQNRVILPLSAAITAASLLLAATPGYALQLEEVLVTAQKRVENLQDVPVSASVVSGETIRDLGITDFEELSAMIPNFSVSKNAIQDTVSIRGVNSDSQAGGDQSVGIFVDGVFRGRGVQSRFAFMDVASVEVLRGPQGTLFGKNTIAGALNITSARPTEQFEGNLSAKYEFEHEETEIQGAFSGALFDAVRGRIAFTDKQLDDGWVENSFYDETQNHHEWAARGTLEIDILENLMATLRYEHSDFDNEGAPYDTIATDTHALVAAYPDPAERPFDGESNIGAGGAIGSALDLGTNYFMKGDSDELSARFDLDVDAGTWTAVVGFSKYEFDRGQDVDFGPLPVVTFLDSEEFEQSSLEVRFANDGDGDLTWLAGAYWQQSDLTARGDLYTGAAAVSGAITGIANQLSTTDPAINPYITAGAALGLTPVQVVGAQAPLAGLLGGAAALWGIQDPVINRVNELEQDSDTWALFGQFTYSLSDAVSTTIGLRYGEEEKEATQFANVQDLSGNVLVDPALGPFTLFSIFPLDVTAHQFNDLFRDESNLSWMANVSWDITNDIMTYTTISTGFKGGGFNAIALGAGITEAEFEEEEAISYEVGAKMTLADGAAEVNMAYFFMDFDNLQTTQFTGSSGFIVVNAANAEVQGIEIDARWQATEELLLSGSMGWIDFEFKEYTSAGCTDGQIAAQRLATLNPLYNAANCSADGINDLSGKTNQDTPEFTANVSALWRRQVLDNFELSAQLDVIYSDEYFATGDLDPNTLQDSFFKVSAMITIGPDTGAWDVSLVGNNLTDEKTYQYANDVPLFSGNHFGTMQRTRAVALRGRMNF